MMQRGRSIKVSALCWFLAVFLAGCTAQPPAVDGLATNGTASDGGDEETDGGFGGTGILGAVTAVETDGTTRLLVNGLALAAGPDTEVASVLGATTASTLEPGEVILAEALGQGSATDPASARRGLRASRLARYVPVAGVIEAIAVDGSRLRILGIDVTVPSDTPISGTDAVGALKPGLRLAVSGFWQGSGVFATHLRLLPSGSASVVSGPTRRDARGRLVIGGVPIALKAVATESTASATLAAKGRYRAGKLEAATLFQDLAAPPRSSVAALSVQGFPVAGPMGRTLAGQPDIAVTGGMAGSLGVFAGPAALSPAGETRAATPVAPGVARGLRARAAALSYSSRVGARATGFRSVVSGTFDGPVANAIASGVLSGSLAGTVAAGRANAVGQQGAVPDRGLGTGLGVSAGSRPGRAAIGAAARAGSLGALGRGALGSGTPGRSSVGEGGVGASSGTDAGAAGGRDTGPAGRGRGRAGPGLGGRGGPRGGPAGGLGGRGRR